MASHRVIGAVFVLCCGALLLILSSVSLAGYGLDHPSFYMSGGFAMARNTAFGLFVAGFAVFFTGMALFGLARSFNRK